MEAEGSQVMGVSVRGDEGRECAGRLSVRGDEGRECAGRLREGEGVD